MLKLDRLVSGLTNAGECSRASSKNRRPRGKKIQQLFDESETAGIRVISENAWPQSDRYSF
jgi:hypothetical protein